MRVLITGADGFVGKNLQLHLSERPDIEVVSFTRENDSSELPSKVSEVDFIFHLAGVNRPQNPEEFLTENASLTHSLCEAIKENGRRIPVVFSSSIQAACDNPYGRSKRAAEEMLIELQNDQGISVHLFRLPNVFGKWCKPNYNSVVATFCHNIARGLPIHVNSRSAPLELAYVDDLIECFMQLMDGAEGLVDEDGFSVLSPTYALTVGELSEQLQAFRDSRLTLTTERVGAGLTRALYSTYVSYLSPQEFSYEIPMHGDERGVFVEMLKTTDSGQFSYFTAHPGITRGGHYHHSKTEKFLVLKGNARFSFRHMQSDETFDLVTSGEKPKVVESVPGWSHDITNIGDEEMLVMLWANEVFDSAKPDTYSSPLQVTL